jgi:hypothetical protein
MKKLLLASVALLALTATASADIALRLCQDGCGTLQSDFFGAPGQTQFSAINQPFGVFNIANITGSTVGSLVPPTVLSSNQLDIQATAPGSHTLDVWFTAQNLTSPFGIQDLLSSFTVVELTGPTLIPPTLPWTATLQTLYSAANANFTGSVIASANFIGLGTVGQSSNEADPAFNLGAGPYSLTAHYTINTTGPGQANTAISLAVPGPLAGAGIPGLLTACFGLFGLNRWRRRRQAA